MRDTRGRRTWSTAGGAQAAAGSDDGVPLARVAHHQQQQPVAPSRQFHNDGSRQPDSASISDEGDSLASDIQATSSAPANTATDHFVRPLRRRSVTTPRGDCVVVCEEEREQRGDSFQSLASASSSISGGGGLEEPQLLAAPEPDSIDEEEESPLERSPRRPLSAQEERLAAGRQPAVRRRASSARPSPATEAAERSWCFEDEDEDEEELELQLGRSTSDLLPQAAAASAKRAASSPRLHLGASGQRQQQRRAAWWTVAGKKRGSLSPSPSALLGDAGGSKPQESREAPLASTPTTTRSTSSLNGQIAPPTPITWLQRQRQRISRARGQQQRLASSQQHLAPSPHASSSGLGQSQHDQRTRGLETRFHSPQHLQGSATPASYYYCGDGRSSSALGGTRAPNRWLANYSPSFSTSTSSVFALYALRYAHEKFHLALRAFHQWYRDNLNYNKLSNRMEFNQQKFERWYKSKGRPLSLRALDHYDQVVIWIAGE